VALFEFTAVLVTGSVNVSVVSSSLVDTFKVEGASELASATFMVVSSCLSGSFVILVSFGVFVTFLVVLISCGVPIVEFGLFLWTRLMQDLSPQHWITIFLCFFRLFLLHFSGSFPFLP